MSNARLLVVGSVALDSVETPFGKAENVLVVPTTAVEGSVGTGNVYLPSADGGKAAKQAVGLGLTDGKQVQITTGLKKGDTILQFVPGAAADSGNGADGSGN